MGARLGRHEILVSGGPRGPDADRGAAGGSGARAVGIWGLGSIISLPLPGREPLLSTSQDDALARDLAAAAGERLIALKSGWPADGADHGAHDTAALRRAGDQQSHAFLAGELARLRPDDAVLSEEGADDRARLAADRVWIVDPLDGTKEFGEAGRTDWAVHVALWERGRLTAGAVALPAQGTVLSTADPPDSRRASAGPLRVLVSRSRPPEFADTLAGQLGASLIPMGSAGAKAAAVITGDADAYVHSGGQYEWDSAAPVAVATAAGLHASRIDGSSLRYNQADPSVPDILICPAGLAPVLLAAIGRVLPPRTLARTESPTDRELS
jgi:3'(2'), 5'-bisphosphate nucleotidase